MIEVLLRKLNENKIIPLYAIFPLLACFILNNLIYFGTMKLNANRFHFDFTSSIDNKIPVIPEFIFIYFICYLFWAINYILIVRLNKEHCMRFVFADMSSRIVCLIFFVVMPTTNIRPQIIDSGISNQILLHLYTIDRPENLFPSIHCLVSWFCYIGIRGKKQITLWYRGFSCVFAILVFLSTQFTKQHYLIDIIGGVLVAEITYYIAMHTNCYKYLWIILEKVSTIIFGKGTNHLPESEKICVKEQKEPI